MSSADMRTIGDNSVDVEKLEQVANHLARRMAERDEIADDIKAIKSGGKALGFDMAVVAKLVELKRDEEKLRKHQDLMAAMSLYAPLLDVEPFA